MSTLLSFTAATDRVKQSLDIIDVVQRSVVLKKNGRNYVGLCPFHNDKHPSMTVSREKNLFKCFACGAGGDAISFLMKLNHQSFADVIRELASDQGITIEDKSGQSSEERQAALSLKDKLFALNARTAMWFSQQLLSETGTSVRNYLASREISPEVMHRFSLGYAPSGWDNLINHLKLHAPEVKENLEILTTAGLAGHKINEGESSGDSAQGRYYDKFRHRLIIPIHNEKGEVIAFGGRALSDEDKPKYLNSPETPVYHKSQVLYGLHLAKDSIRQNKAAIIMEGYFDVIRAHAGGITEAVGSCGTALTEQHLKLLLRYGAETLYLAFDADAAGNKAALSAIELIEPYLPSSPLQVKIVIFGSDSAKDPDDFIRQSGGEAFRALLPQARPWLTFKLDNTLVDLDTRQAEGRVKAVQALLPHLLKIQLPVLRQEMLKRYAERIGVSQEALALELKRHEQVSSFQKKGNKSLQNFPSNQAIFGSASSSFTWNTNQNTKRPYGTGYSDNRSYYNNSPYKRRNRSIPTDNLAELRQPLQPSNWVAERNLIKLMLTSAETFNQLKDRMTELSFSDATHQLLAQFLSSATVVESLDTLLTQLNPDIPEQQTLQSELAALMLTTEQFQTEFGLTTNQSPSTTLQLFTQFKQRMTAHQRKEALNSLASKARQLEHTDDVSLQSIELQYTLRDSLQEGNSGQDSHQALPPNGNETNLFEPTGETDQFV